MNVPTNSSRPLRRWTFWRWVAVVLAASVLIVAVAAWHVLTLSRDAAALRKELLGADLASVETRVQLTAGAGLISAVRGVLACVDDVPAEIRRGARVIRSASVGVYRVSPHAVLPPGADWLRRADRLMERRDWARIVGVVEAHSIVLVYAPATASLDAPDRVCVVVSNDEHVVIVSARLAPAELAQFLAEQSGLDRGRLFAAVH